jgi:hypothetical protein
MLKISIDMEIFLEDNKFLLILERKINTFKYDHTTLISILKIEISNHYYNVWYWTCKVLL